MLQQLVAVREQPRHGTTRDAIAARLHIDPLQIEPALDVLTKLDWVARLDEPGDARYVLLCDPATTPARPLLVQLLVAPSSTLAPLWQHAGFDALTVHDLVGR